MKNIIASAVFTFFFLSVTGQTEKVINTDIKHVTVFPDRAQIEQEGTVVLTPGSNLVKLSGLSPYIDAQSVQVKGYGDFVIMSVNHQNNYLQNLEDSPEVKSIRSQIEVLQSKVEDENVAIASLTEKEAFLIANRAILLKEATITAEQFKNVMDLYSSNTELVKTTTLKKQRLLKEYNRQIAALQQQVAEKLGRQQLPSGEIIVTASSEKPVSGKFSFSYIVSNAGWYPSYDIRVDDLKKPVLIDYKANVFQNSGIDWKDVKLSFSNATPWVTGDIPVLNPWFLDYYSPVILRGMTPGVMVKQAPARAEVADNYKMVEEANETAPPVVEKQIMQTTTVFDITVPNTIHSDGKIQTVEIQRLTTPADFKYVTLPKLAPLAYLSANIADWAKLSLQTGEATLYFENTFVGKTTLNVNQLSDTLALSLGTDNSILVKREKRKDFTSRKTIGANRTDILSFLITIRNTKSIPVSITIHDQLPVSSNSGISVDPVEISGGSLNVQTGEIKWDVAIKPLETKQFVLTYSVKYPKDKTVILE